MSKKLKKYLIRIIVSLILFIILFIIDKTINLSTVLSIKNSWILPLILYFIVYIIIGYDIIIKAFLSTIKKDNIMYPTRKNFCQINDSIIWTYHPNYLNRIGKIGSTIVEVNKVRKK